MSPPADSMTLLTVWAFAGSSKMAEAFKAAALAVARSSVGGGADISFAFPFEFDGAVFHLQIESQHGHVAKGEAAAASRPVHVRAFSIRSAPLSPGVR